MLGSVIPLEKMFVLLFMMTGPLRVVPMFAGLTREFDPAVRNRLAWRGVLYAAVGVLLAVFVGHIILKSWGATPQALAAATGLLLLLTALQALVGWPATPSPVKDVESNPDRLALSPLAFPTIVPPFAVGVLILFAAHFPDLESQLKMVGLAFGLLAADLIGMRYAQQIMRVIGMSTLQVLGAIFGVLQLALALQMIRWAVQSLRN
jgi:multiple antibiotic resistance protein